MSKKKTVKPVLTRHGFVDETNIDTFPEKIDEFRFWVHKWMGKLGITGWRVDIEELDLGRDKVATQSEVTAHSMHMNARFVLNHGFKWQLSNRHG